MEQVRNLVYDSALELDETRLASRCMRCHPPGRTSRFARAFHLHPAELELSARKVPHFRGQEALTNAVRHARATEIHVELRQRSQELLLLIRDDGGL